MLFLHGSDVIDRVVNVISKHQGACLLIVYGSVAKGTYNPKSDIDLALIFKGNLKKVKEEILEVSATYNVPISLKILTPGTPRRRA